jgi:hypothetical protein
MTTPARRARKPLISSTLALRALATAITLSSFGGMTIFASENLYWSPCAESLRRARSATADPDG